MAGCIPGVEDAAGDNSFVAKRVSSTDLIGRAEELAAMTAALERAAAGEFGAILVGGEAGVGKTRLTAEVELRAVAAGARVLAGDCVKLAEGELPFAPLTAALRPLARELGPAELEMLPGREELARLLPELGGTAEAWISRDSAFDEPLAQSRLFEVLLGLFTRLGEQSPVVLVIEDLHWADRSTRDFLGFLIRNAHSARLLLVCTYRSDELHRRHPLRPFLAELDRRGAHEPGDRRGPVHLGEDGERPRLPDPRQARGPRPRRGGDEGAKTRNPHLTRPPLA